MPFYNLLLHFIFAIIVTSGPIFAALA